jgi:hypothetical protein
MFCAEFMKDEFKPCIEFKGRIKSKEDLQQIDKDFVVINDK